jgi:branched-chain amino acid transport system permease protein
MQYVIDAFSLGSLYALFALGIALVFGVMQLINFGHGELIMVGGYALVLISEPSGVVAIAVMVVIVVCVALTMERIAFRPVRGADAETLLVTSFAVSFLLQSLATLTLGALPRGASVLPGLNKPLSVAGLNIRGLDVATVGITVVLVTALVLFLKTRIGVQMRAAAEDFRTARLMGVAANKVIAIAFAMSGFLAAVAAVILVAQTGLVAPTIGVSAVLAAFIATIVGGIGSLTGAVLGGYLLGAVTVSLQALLPLALRSYRDAFVFVAVVAILILRPQGLLTPKSATTRV